MTNMSSTRQGLGYRPTLCNSHISTALLVNGPNLQLGTLQRWISEWTLQLGSEGMHVRTLKNSQYIFSLTFTQTAHEAPPRPPPTTYTRFTIQLKKVPTSTLFPFQALPLDLARGLLAGWQANVCGRFPLGPVLPPLLSLFSGRFRQRLLSCGHGGGRGYLSLAGEQLGFP